MSIRVGPRPVMAMPGAANRDEACLEIDLAAIERGARAVTAQCAAAGIAVAGVTKVACGSPQVAGAMLAGGVAQLADARLANLRRLRQAGLRGPLWLLRAPSPAQAAAAVALADVSLNSELETVRRLSAEATALGRRHDVVLMIELGDLREGLLPDQAFGCAQAVAALPGIRLLGVGANLGCISGIQPTARNLAVLVEVAGDLRRRLGIELPIVSGGNSASLSLLDAGCLPAGINHLRVGEGILLPDAAFLSVFRGAAYRKAAFQLSAPVIEDRIKPARPYGLAGKDAFGRMPRFDQVPDAPMRRLLLAIGEEDIRLAGLQPDDARLRVIGASSDHLVLDASAVGTDYPLGQRVRFSLDYGALLTAMTSPYVEKRYLDPR